MCYLQGFITLPRAPSHVYKVLDRNHTVKPQKCFDGEQTESKEERLSECVVEAYSFFQTSVTFWFYSTISLYTH